MERFLIDYEIGSSQDQTSQPEGKEEPEGKESQEEQERRERARKAQYKANAAWQKKEYEQINVKLPKGLKKAFLLACREKGISGRQYIIDSMRKLIDEEIGRFYFD